MMLTDPVDFPLRPKDDGIFKAIVAGFLAGVSAALALFKMTNKG